MSAYKIKLHYTVLILFSSMFVQCSFAADLLEVYSQVESNNYQLQSSLSDHQILQSKRDEVVSEYDPQLLLNVKPAYRFGDHRSLNKAGIEYSLSLNKRVYQRQLDERIFQANQAIQREQTNVDLQRQKSIADTGTAYLTYLSARNRLWFSQSERQTMAKQLARLNTLFRSQLATITDISETRSRLDQLLSNSALAHNALNRAKQDLHLLTGKTYDSLVDLNSSHLPVSLSPSDLQGWLKIANVKNHELRLARHDLQINNTAISIEKNGNSPSVDLFASYEGEANIDRPGQSDSEGRLGVELNIPLYSGNRQLSTVRTATLVREKSHRALQFKRREVAQKVQLAYLTVRNDIDSIHALARAVHSANEALRSVQLGQHAGTRTISDVLSALRESYAIQTDYAEARYRYLRHWLALKLSAGALSVNDLQQINNALVRTAQPYPAQQPMTLEEAWGMN